jgi:hypothetical protein
MDQSNRIGSQTTGPAAEQTKETVRRPRRTWPRPPSPRSGTWPVRSSSRAAMSRLRCDGGVTEQARVQQGNLAEAVRRVADELEAMVEHRPDSPAATVVSRVADGGHQVAQYLADRGPEGLLAEVQDFARRRPGAFLATALVSGFVQRLGRGLLNEAQRRRDPPHPGHRHRCDRTSGGTSCHRVDPAHRAPPFPAP